MAYAVAGLTGDGSMITWDAITGAVGGTGLEVNNTAGVIGAVQVIGGTAGSIALQGSLDGTNWVTLKDPSNTDIALTTLGAYAEFTTAARFIRPLGNGSSSAAIVRVVLRG